MTPQLSFPSSAYAQLVLQNTIIYMVIYHAGINSGHQEGQIWYYIAINSSNAHFVNYPPFLHTYIRL